MPSTVQKVITDLKQETRQKRFDAYPLMFELARNEPARIGELLIAVMRDFPKGGTFASDAVSYLPLADFPAVVAEAIQTFDSGKSVQAAEDILAHCSLQCPQALHPHLDSILRLRPNGSNYYADWPWRESGASQLKALKSRLTDPQSANDERQFILDAMYETRDPKMLRAAMNALNPQTPDILEAMLADETKAEVQELLAELKQLAANASSETKAAAAEEPDWNLLGVGFEERGGKLHRLYPWKAWHLAFDRDYLKADKQPLHLQKQHPTWSAPDPSAQSSPFGGPGTHICAVCGAQGHHLVTLDQVPKNLGVTGMKRLVLETCLSCLGWEEGVLFYRHGKSEPHRQLVSAANSTSHNFRQDR